MEGTATQLKQIISMVFEIQESEIEPDAHFFDDIGVDSMRALEVVAAVEKKFNIEFEDEEVEHLTTFSKVLANVQGKMENIEIELASA